MCSRSTSIRLMNAANDILPTCGEQPTSCVYRIVQKLPQAPQSSKYRGQGCPLQRRSPRRRPTNVSTLSFVGSEKQLSIGSAIAMLRHRQALFRPSFAWLRRRGIDRAPTGNGWKMSRTTDFLRDQNRASEANVGFAGRSAAKPWSSERPLWAGHDAAPTDWLYMLRLA